MKQRKPQSRQQGARYQFEAIKKVVVDSYHNIMQCKVIKEGMKINSRAAYQEKNKILQKGIEVNWAAVVSTELHVAIIYS